MIPLRGAGEIDAILEVVPWWLSVLAAGITQLGNYSTVLVGAAVVWLLFERGRGPWPVVVTAGAIAVSKVIKNAFALPRPEVIPSADPLPGAFQSMFVETVTIGGYGFPSGHAIGTTVLAGIVVVTVDVGALRSRTIVATVVVALVSLSRVVLAVHYPIDILAGVVIGLAYLVGALWLLGRLSLRAPLAPLAGGEQT